MRFVTLFLLCVSTCGMGLSLSAENTTVRPGNTSNSTSEPSYYRCGKGIFPCSGTITGNVVLMAFYGVILGIAAKLITDGAELLLDLGLRASVVGGLILPLLGALPDAAIIIFSGSFGSTESAQHSLQVGMGTLAGSTVMLLTLPWFGSLILGRNDIQHNGEAKDETGTGPLSLTKQGVTILPDVLYGIIAMLLTALPYLIIQGADWHFGPTKTGPQPAYIQRAAAATMSFALIGLVAYLILRVYDSRSSERRAEKHREEIHQVLSSTKGETETSTHEEETSLLEKGDSKKGRGLRKKYYGARRGRDDGTGSESQEMSAAEGEQPNETAEGEEKEKPVSKRSLVIKSWLSLEIGVILVIGFSGPMCDVLKSITDPKNESYLPIRPFYVSFVITPICSNAPELFSSLVFAMKKKKVNISMTYAQLYGAATMNNTLCLAVFMALVYIRSLKWQYSAEVFVILLVELIVGIIGFRKTYKLWLGIPIALLYFISIGLVAFLESPAIGWK
ncbi:uncharacterized protein LOC134183249 isoform X2 [Corticium candelabrum]|uniref:uncharacterized protein LOC134183249 isoform X2 n=1 Tax=Corticium candelabrum TaxID=121492 RepID=UPI002E261030|nr:uncharacterized protein LOC134183249 isoform X2 [Corticium candelabrum]